jgi:putative ABC transport system permease protein
VNHFGLALRNLKRRPARSILTVLGVAFAVGSFITLYGLSRSVHENVQASFEEHGGDLTVRRRGIAEPFGGTIPESLIPEIAKVLGVAAVAGQLISFAATDHDDHVIAVGWSPGSFYWSSVPLQEGRLPLPGERKVALVGNDIARALGKRVGDDIALLGEKFHIVGITNYSSVINRNQVIVDLADLQELTFRTGAVTYLSIKLVRPISEADIDRIVSTIEGMEQLSVSRGDVLRNDSLIGFMTAVSTAMAWVALFMGVLMVLNTLLMAVLERTREIGILAAIGWSRQRIMGALMIEGLILSAFGSVVGILIGVAGSHFLSEVPAIGRYVALRPTPILIGATALAALVLGLLGSLYPAFVATRASPAAALERA